ncbi:MAG: hypothetical protein FWG97_04820 [Deltaproteobacteria bacterium]|nr:hypothetical protein [Deltaproteobacteria bacterium]
MLYWEQGSRWPARPFLPASQIPVIIYPCDGETIFIGTYGRADAVLASASSVRPKKRLGLLEGKLTVPDDFDAPLPPEIIAAFEGDTE